MFIAQRCVVENIKKLYAEFLYVLHTIEPKQNENWVKKRKEPFLARCSEVFDISARSKLGPQPKKKKVGDLLI